MKCDYISIQHLQLKYVWIVLNDVFKGKEGNMHFSWQKLGYELISNWDQAIQLTILFSGKK